MKAPASDMRSPLAKARDEFLASEEGRRITNHDILKAPYHQKYLVNRITLAFLAGVKAAKKLSEI